MFFKKISKFISTHKIISLFIIILIFGFSFFVFNLISKKQTTLKYIVSSATKGALITSISGTGQVSTSNEAIINSKVSGDVSYINVLAGEDAESGKILLKINSSDAEQAVRDAQASYDLAVLSFEELKSPPDELTLLQAESALLSAQESKTNSEASLNKAYDDGFNSVANTFLDLPDVVSGLNDILYGQAFNTYQGNAEYYAGSIINFDESVTEYKQDAYNKYLAARSAYDINFTNYKKTNRFSSTNEIEELIIETYDTTKLIAEAVKSVNNLIQFYKDQFVQRSLNYSSIASTHLTSLNSYTSKTNSFLSSLLSIKQTIENSKNSAESAQRSIQEKQISLNKIKAGPTEIEIKSQELSVTQKYNALLTAKENLNDCYVVAPFSGTVAKINVSKGDSISSGESLITFISKGKIVDVSLNEVDISKVKVGDAVTLAFDAITDFSLTGQVSQVDTIGTVSSGVVNYNVTISFADDTNQVKPGMSASVNIITEAKTDVLLVPNSAIKSNNDAYYVQAPAEAIDVNDLNNNKGVVLKRSLVSKTVEIGSSNDSYTEITSGLSENDQIITSIITGVISSSGSSNSGTTTKNNNNNMIMPGLGGGPPN